jgi:hypothetical protein
VVRRAYTPMNKSLLLLFFRKEDLTTSPPHNSAPIAARFPLSSPAAPADR